MLPTFEEYCALIASLPDQFPSIQSSTLTVYTIGPFAAEVEGSLTFEAGYMLDVLSGAILRNSRSASRRWAGVSSG